MSSDVIRLPGRILMGGVIFISNRAEMHSVIANDGNVLFISSSAALHLNPHFI